MKEPINFRLVTRVIAVACVITGILLWNIRLDFRPEEALKKIDQPAVTSLDSKSMSNLTDACNVGASKSGWITFLITASLTSDNTTRGVFETAQDEQGLYLDYNPGDSALLRVGLTSDGATKFIPIRTVRQDEDVFIAIGVRQDRLRVVTNAVDRTIQWSDFKVTQLRCDAVKSGISDEIECDGCNVEVRYLAGSGGRAFDEIMGSVSNRRFFQIKSWIGNGLIVLGMFLFAQQIKKRNQHAN